MTSPVKVGKKRTIILVEKTIFLFVSLCLSVSIILFSPPSGYSTRSPTLREAALRASTWGEPPLERAAHRPDGRLRQSPLKAEALTGSPVAHGGNHGRCSWGEPRRSMCGRRFRTRASPRPHCLPKTAFLTKTGAGLTKTQRHQEKSISKTHTLTGVVLNDQ